MNLALYKEWSSPGEGGGGALLYLAEIGTMYVPLYRIWFPAS